MKKKTGTVKGAIFSHILVGTTGTVLSLVTHAVLLTWLLRDLGLAWFGVYSLMTAMALQFNLFDDSLGSWLTREVSSRGEEDSGSLRCRIGCAATLNLLVALPVLLLVSLLTVVGLRNQDPEILAMVLLIGATGFWLEMAMNLGRKMLEGRERFAVIRAIQVGGLLLRLAGFAVVRYCFPDSNLLAAYSVCFLISLAMQAGLLALVLKVEFGFLPVPSLMGFRKVKTEVVRFGLPIFGVKCTSILSSRLDLWLVATFLPAPEVGLYGIATRFYSLVIQAVEVSRSFILPVSIRLKQKFTPSQFRDFFLRATSLSVLLTFAAATVVALNLKPILLAWFGADSLGAIPPLILLLVFAVTVSFRTVGQTVVLAEGRFSLFLKPFVAAGLVNFALSIWCTAFWGVVGPAVGTCVSGFLLLFWNTSRILEILDTKPAAFLHTVASGVIVWSIAAGAGLVVGEMADGVTGITTRSLVYVSVHVLLYFTFLLRRADRTFLFGLFRGGERILAT